MRDRSNDDAMAEMFRDDPEFALDVLNDILADGNQGELQIFLRQMALATGGVAKTAEQTGLNRTNLYRSLSPNAEPKLSTVMAILGAFGIVLQGTTSTPQPAPGLREKRKSVAEDSKPGSRPTKHRFAT